MPDVRRPGRSSRCSREVSFDSGTTKIAERTATTPIGTLMKKIQFQEMCSVMIPPSSGPIASAIAETPAQIPIAVPRSFTAKVAEMIERVAGIISAAPTPWTARAPISSGALDESPHASEESVKMTRPIVKSSRRPRRSPSFPPVSRSDAKVRA